MKASDDEYIFWWRKRDRKRERTYLLWGTECYSHQCPCLKRPSYLEFTAYSLLVTHLSTFWCMEELQQQIMWIAKTDKELIHFTHLFMFSQNWNPTDRHQIVIGVNICRNSVLSTTCTINNLSSKTQSNTDKINIYVYRNQKLHCIKQTKTQSKLGVQGINNKWIKMILI